MSPIASGTPPGRVIKPVVGAAAVVLAVGLVWGLRSLIVPVCVGGLLAYICRPIVARLERYRIPRGLGIGLLLLAFVLAGLVGVNSVRAVTADEASILELRVRALHALHDHYRTLLGLDRSWSGGNRLYRLLYRDLDPLLDRAGELLALTPDERALVASREGETAARWDRLLAQERANVAALEMRARQAGRLEPRPSTPPPASVATSEPSGLGDLLSTWIVAPLVFLFWLADTGDIKRGVLRAMPNRLFEPALAVLADVDRALGDYMRGIFFECCALGLTVVVFIAVVGVPLPWAIVIGILTGATNIVPYMGFAAALLTGLGYALVAEDVRPLLPFVTAETFALWVVVAVALAELLKNVVYEPIVLGGAVKLHPLVVVIGVAGGAVLFGAAGMLLAIPTITVVRVLVASSARHLTAYGLV